MGGTVGQTLGDQLRSSGKVSQAEARERLSGDTDRAAKETCAVIAKVGRTLGSAGNSARATDAFRTYVVGSVVASIGSDVRQLNDLNVQFPAFMLSDPAKNPPFGVDPASLSPTYLNSYLRPEFVSQAGGARFPTEGDIHYDEFARWTRSDNNPLGSRAAYFSSDLLRQIDDCLLSTRKK